MLNRRSALFAAVAIAALLAAGTAYLALRPAPHMPTFEPPSKLKPEEYESKSEAELLKLAEAGDWGALKAIDPLVCPDNGNAAGRLLRRYADQGYDEARFRLGTIHLYNSPRATELFENTDFRNEPIESCRRVLENYREQTKQDDFASISKALTLLNLAVKGGHPGAQSVLGNQLLKEEKGSPRNIPRALDLLERAARAGETQAAGVLCRLYYQGRLVQRDDAKCLEYARMTKNPIIPAALLVLNGRGDPAAIPSDLQAFNEAMKKVGTDYWYLKFVLARLELRTRNPERASEWASQRLDDDTIVHDYDEQCRGESAVWFEDDPINTGYLYAHMEPAGMRSNYDSTGACLNDAQSGDKIAQYALGCSRLLIHGDDSQSWICDANGRRIFTPAATDEDKAEGVEWLRKSAGQGFHAAMGKLGECLLRGVGVKADKVEAAYWLARATTDIHTRYAKLRDEALAALTPEERAGVLRRVDEARAKIAGNKSAESPKP